MIDELYVNKWKNDEPFVVAYIPGVFVIIPLDGTTEMTVAIYQGGEIVHKLDNKLLDLAWLPTYDEKPLMEEQTIEVTGQGNNGEAMYVTSNYVENRTTLLGKTVVVYLDGIGEECVVQFADTEYFSKTSWGRVTFYTAATTVTVNTPTATSISFALYLKEAKKMPEEFLPDDATVFHLTSPNGTKFAITVSDDGTLSAAAT